MLIGEVVSKTGLSRDTIRFYEKKGLIMVKRSNSEWNNYKNYDSEVLKRLILIKKAKEFGFTLNEISEILDLTDENKASCSILSGKVKEKINEIDRKIKELNTLKKIILSRNNFNNSCCSPDNLESNCNSVEILETA